MNALTRIASIVCEEMDKGNQFDTILDVIRETTDCPFTDLEVSNRCAELIGLA